MKRKALVVVSAVVTIAIILVGTAYAYFRYFGPQSIMQNNPDKYNCRQGNVLDGVDRQARFTVCQHVRKL